MEFKVGQVWENRIGEQFEVLLIRPGPQYPVWAKPLGAGKPCCFTLQGLWYKGVISRDLVKLVTDVATPAAKENMIEFNAEGRLMVACHECKTTGMHIYSIAPHNPCELRVISKKKGHPGACTFDGEVCNGCSLVVCAACGEYTEKYTDLERR